MNTAMTYSSDGSSVGSSRGIAGAGSCFPVPSTQACSFELDVQWILDIIDKVSDFLRKVGDAAKKVFDIIGKVLEKLSGILDWFCWIPGIGKMAKKAVDWACEKAGDAAKFVFNLQADLLQFCKNGLAPWEIKSAGEQINSQIIPRMQEFTDALSSENFSSNKSWKGIAADRFRAAAERQHDYATQVLEGATELGNTVQEMGEKGVEATKKFVKNFFKAAVSLVSAIYKLWQVPVGTALAAKDVFSLVKAILQMVKVWVEMIIAVVIQTVKIRKAAQNAAPDGQWPAIAN